MTFIDLPEAAILFTLRNEDYNWDTKARLEDLQDGAGWTFIGITQKYDGGYLKDKHDIDVPGLATLYGKDKQKAVEIIKDTYEQKYWHGRGFDKIKVPRIAIRLFDLAVNCGFGGLNKIIENCGLSTRFDSDDVNRLIDKQGEGPALAIIKNAALQYYKGLKGWPRFGNGWSNRLKKDEFKII